MSYQSIDQLQRALADGVFSYAIDKKKAAGRALGTMVEIVTYYVLRSWGLRDHIAIERPLIEFGNPDIAHNVEFSLHPVLNKHKLSLLNTSLPLTATKLAKNYAAFDKLGIQQLNKSVQLLSKNLVRRNSATIADDGDRIFLANIDGYTSVNVELTLGELHSQPFAVFECKRVGVEEGMKKGPQTIEKAKQGAYVARTVSSLQKYRSPTGEARALIERSDGTQISGAIESVTRQVVDGDAHDLLEKFILTIGVVSNHGNWFTADDHNKEIKVLAQSYDWLLFLTDASLVQFVEELLLNPVPELAAAKSAFSRSYTGDKRKANAFTKVQIDQEADAALQQYFLNHKKQLDNWFNVIAPKGRKLSNLRFDLKLLAKKNWRKVHRL